MTIVETILAIVATLLGGTNIFQAFFLKAERRKHAAEATQTEIAAMRQVIEELRAEVAADREQIADYRKRYDALEDKYNKLRDDFMEYKDKQAGLK